MGERGGVSVGVLPTAEDWARFFERLRKISRQYGALGGAKNHMIVLPDADLEMVADAVVGSVFGSAGQRCPAGSVVVGVGDVYEPVRGW